MARPGVTREQVFTTADALLEEGTQPTVKLVRERIGGSFSTITPHLAVWKEQRGGRGTPAVPDIPESVAATMRQVWAVAWSAGQQAIQAERDGLAAARKEMEQEQSDLISEVAELEGKLDVALGERDALTTKLTEEDREKQRLQEIINNLMVENARLAEREANTERRAEEIRIQMQELQRELAAERDSFAAARKEMEQERSDLINQVAGLGGKLDVALGECDTLATKLTEETQAKARLEETLTGERIENARLTERVANTEARAQELWQQVQDLQRDLSRLAEREANATSVTKAP